MVRNIIINTVYVLLLTVLFTLHSAQDSVSAAGDGVHSHENVAGDMHAYERRTAHDKIRNNHDHSANLDGNKGHEEYVDTEPGDDTTVHTVTSVDKHINRDLVTTTSESIEPGISTDKAAIHAHGSGTHTEDAFSQPSRTKYIIWLALVAGFLGIGVTLFLLRLSSGRKPEESPEGFDLMNIRWVKQFVTWKYFRQFFIIPTLIIFLFIIFLGFFDTQDGQRNIATVFTWTLWWSLIIFTLILAGRFWCMMCPFAAAGDFAQKFVSLNKKLPRRLQNMNMQTIGFIILTWAFTIMAFGSSPLTTAVVMIIILNAAVIFSIIYQRRSFCRHLCPIGAVIGIYSMISPIELRSSNKVRCDAHKKKTCVEACPMLESPKDMDNNIYCNFCMKCQSACPSQNLGLRLRSFGKDIDTSLRKSRAEAFAALFLLGVVIVETLAMTSSWKPLEGSVGAFTGITSPATLYTIVFMLVLLLPVGGFYLVCYLLRLWLGKNEYRMQDVITPFAFLFIPLGVGIHFAHNIQHLLTESPIALSATLRLLQKLGIGTSLTVNWNPPPLLGLQPIFYIQMIILMGGFGLTLYVLFRLLRHFHKPLHHIYKMTVAMSLYAIFVLVSAIYMLGLPMSGRHGH